MGKFDQTIKLFRTIPIQFKVLSDIFDNYFYFGFALARFEVPILNFVPKFSLHSSLCVASFAKKFLLRFFANIPVCNSVVRVAKILATKKAVDGEIYPRGFAPFFK